MDPALGVFPAQALSEKLVARLWEEQRPLRFPLATSDGDEIQVVYRGRRRWDRGPDFTGALIAWPGAKLKQGDVEVHLRSSDWWSHGHHRDPHYNGVILQVVLWDDAPLGSVRRDGIRIPVVALFSYLSIPLDTLLMAPEPETRPPIPCWPGSPDDTALAAILDDCGRERLAAKAARFESDLTCTYPDQLLYQGIAVALGYSQNRLPFRRLAERLPLELLFACLVEIRGHEAMRSRDGSMDRVLEPSRYLETLLLGAAGLLPSHRALVLYGDDRRVAALEARWSSYGPSLVGESMDPGEWEFFRVRPANFPTRRVAALAKLVARWPREGLAGILERLASSLEARALPRVLEDLVLLRSADGYWDDHCDFGLSLRRPADLIGRQRAAEIVVNVFIPFLVAWAARRGNPELARRVEELFHLYPKRGDNELSRYMATQITASSRPRVARSACRQQGLLHLYWSRCEAKRCAECLVQAPLV